MKMRPFLRLLTVLTVLAGLALPAHAVEPEKGHTTLTNLLQELQQSYSSALESDSPLVNSRQRREQLVDMVKAADEMTLNLYSRESDFTFDQAFQQSVALKGAHVTHNAVQQMLKNWRRQGLIVKEEKRFRKVTANCGH